MNPTVGTALQGGKYLLEQALGAGGSPTFRATQTHSNKPVLLKTLPALAGENRHRRQGQWERVRLLSQCRHPALASVLDWFEEDGALCVVMEWVMGQSLADRVPLQGPIAEPEALQYVRQVGSALSLLHRQGLVHGDVKPENLLQPIGSNLTVLVDFGSVGQSEASGSATGSATGSAYGAIESRSEQATAATDIYGLAASLYFLLTGKPPVPACQRSSVPLTPPRQLQPQISPVVEAAILAGLDLHPASRPPTIAAWFSLLDTAHAPAQIATNDSAKPGSIELPLLMVEPSASGPGPTYSPASSSNSASFNSANSNRNATLTAPKSAVQISNKSPASPAPRRGLPRAFRVGAALAGAIGLGVGLVLRVSGGTGPGSSFFHTEQAFPKKTTAGVKTSVDQQFSPPQSVRTPSGKATTPALSDPAPLPAPVRSLPDPPERSLLPDRKTVPSRSGETSIPQPADSPTVEPDPKLRSTPAPPAPIPPPPIAPAPVEAAPPAANSVPIEPAPSLRSPKQRT